MRPIRSTCQKTGRLGAIPECIGRGKTMHFDWYQATLDAEPNGVIDGIGHDLGAASVSQERGRNNYLSTFLLKSEEGDILATVLAGGNGGRPNVTGSGSNAEAVATSIRSRWNLHDVTRVDAAEDIGGEGVFDQLEIICRGVARQAGVKGHRVLPDDPADGRTYHLGSPTSTSQVRLYDKAAETRRRLPVDRHHEVPDHWTRLEAQVRPRGAQRSLMAMSAPETVWGAAKWTHTLARQVFRGMSIERIKPDILHSTSDAIAFGHLSMQYGPLLRRMAGNKGREQVLDLLAQIIDVPTDR